MEANGDGAAVAERGPDVEMLGIKYFTVAALARELGLCDRTLSNMARRGDGPPRTRIGPRVLYRREAVEAWLLDRQQAPAVSSKTTRRR